MMYYPYSVVLIVNVPIQTSVFGDSDFCIVAALVEIGNGSSSSVSLSLMLCVRLLLKSCLYVDNICK